MVVGVSVVVVGRNYRDALDGLIESLDQQSVPTSQFEVVLVDRDSTDATSDRLHLMATHRPNISVVSAAESATDLPSAWLKRCQGEYVIRLDPEHRLFPEALERLHDYAVVNGLDAVAPRVVQRGASLAEVFLCDEVDLEPACRASALQGAGLLVRRAVLAEGRSLSDPGGVSARVGVLSSYPALRLPHAALHRNGASDRLEVAAPTISWSGPELRIDVSGSVVAGVPEGAPPVRVVPVLRHTDGGLSYLLGKGAVVSSAPGPAALGPSKPAPAAPWALSVVLDIHTAAAGSPLPHGVWEVELHLVDAQTEAAPVTLRWAPCPPAVIGQTIVVPTPSVSPTWQLDVGATTWPLVAQPDPQDASVVETVAGTTLVLALPQVHVNGAEVLTGELVLDRLPLAAQVVTDGEAARLEAFVSGLAGSPRIATRFGDGRAAQSGLCLNISGAGVMEVSKVKPPPPPPAAPPVAGPGAPARVKQAAAKTPAPQSPVRRPSIANSPGDETAEAKSPAKKTAAKKTDAAKSPAKKTAAKKRAVSGKPLNRLQHLRHALPSSWEPMARRVAKNPLAQAVYRRVNKL